jgi:prepilin-type N-terminal cleavage/methylation domain-containing protein
MTQVFSPRRAFTLIELLVVIAIIAVLVALLVPAVQVVRESAAKTQCSNNMKQIAIAVNLHYEDFKVMPSGGLDWGSTRTLVSGRPTDWSSQAWGWLYQILPYVEQRSLWQDSSDITVASTPVELYTCPQLRGFCILPYSGNSVTPRFMNDYVGNGGSWGGCSPGGSNAFDGAFVPSFSVGNRKRTMSMYTDGTSSTLMAGEKYVPYNNLYGSNCNNDQGYVNGWDNDTIVYARSDNTDPNFTQGSASTPISAPVHILPNGPGCSLTFGSIHNQGCMTVFMDGSVHQISYGVAPATWLALCTINASDRPGNDWE